MAKTKIYFWLKIDKKFFDNIFIKRLKTIPGGYTMTVIYIRLMLESLESDCILYYEGYFENLKEELALKLDVSEDDIDMTMAYFTKCGLIQIDEDKNAELPQAKAMVMSETNWASYKREQRQNKERLDNVQKSLTNSNSCPTEIEIEIEKEIDIELEVDNKKTATDTNVYDYYQQRIGSLDGFQYEKLKDYLDIDKLEPELVKRAIDKAADGSKRYFNYVNSILTNWAKNDIRTIARQDEEQRQFVDSRANHRKSDNLEPDPNYPPPY
ncbi:DnaD domain protein [Streptococcus suis]|uniref:DnaD domain protein n=1 Tax=Streptococcus suis TaxID=1307 RepID=UPI00240DC5FE|nr:DnaD domain protein [Streptococcus suis]WFA76418.1 DnaD domain protein [Streptococcus suis]